MSILETLTQPIKAKIRLFALIVFAGALVASGLIAWYYWRDYQKTVDELAVTKVNLISQQATNENLTKQLDLLKKSNIIDESIAIKTADDVKGVKKTTDKIADASIKKVAEIEKTFSTLPATEENIEQKAKALSEVRMVSLWQTYCVGAPDDPRCVGKK